MIKGCAYSSVVFLRIYDGNLVFYPKKCSKFIQAHQQAWKHCDQKFYTEITFETWL